MLQRNLNKPVKMSGFSFAELSQKEQPNLWTPGSSSVNSDDEDVVLVTRICTFGLLHYRNVSVCVCVTVFKIPLTGLFPVQSDLERNGWLVCDPCDGGWRRFVGPRS